MESAGGVIHVGGGFGHGVARYVSDPPQTGLQAAVGREESLFMSDEDDAKMVAASDAAEARRAQRIAREDEEDPWNILAGVREQVATLTAEVEELRADTALDNERISALKAERDALRAENTLLRECNESMRDGMKGLRERLSMPAEGEGEVLQRACEQVDRLTRELAALTDERDDLKSQRDAMRADVPDSEQLLGTVAMTGMIQAHDAHKKQKRTEAELAEMRADLAALRRTVAEECAVACEAVGRDFGDAYKCAGACRAIGAPKERA